MEKLSIEYFKSIGFVTDVVSYILDDDDAVQMHSKDHRINVANFESNSQSPYDWIIHVDNADFETIGTLDCAYVEEFEAFLKLCRYTLNTD